MLSEPVASESHLRKSQEEVHGLHRASEFWASMQFFLFF